jgi:hypothetical protein
MKFSVLILLFLSACGASESATTDSPEPHHEPPAPSEQWLTIPAYPGARRLCSQHVTANVMHIEWTGYASPDPIETVRAFYERNHGAATIEPDGASFRVRANENDVMSAHPVEASHPTCDVAPAPTDRTYFVVSRAIR